MRLSLKILAGVGLAVLALLVAGVIVLRSVDLNQYRDVITGPVAAATGREAAFQGDLELELGFPLRVAANSLSLANAPWGSRPHMVKIGRLEAEVAVLPFIFGRFVIDGIITSDVELFLETDEKGRGNWDFSPEGTEADPVAAWSRTGAALAELPVVEKLALRQVIVETHDGASGESHKADFESVALEFESEDSPLGIEVIADIDGSHVEVSGFAGPVKAFYVVGVPLRLDLEAQGFGATLDVEGSISLPPEGAGIDLVLAAKGEDLAQELKAIGLVLPEIPPFDVKARLTETESVYALEDLEGKFSGSDLAGQARITWAGERPRIDATLRSGVFDLADFGLGEPTGEKAGAAAVKPADGRAIPKLDLPLRDLGALDAKVSLQIKRLVMAADIVAEEVVLAAGLEKGRLTLKHDVGRLDEGSLKGELRADQAGAVGVRLQVRGMNLELLLKGFALSDAVKGGKLDADFDLKGKGKDLRALMAGLNGQAQVVLGEGKMDQRLLGRAGGDVFAEMFRAVNPFAESDPATKLECGVVRASLEAGKMTFDKSIGLETDKLNVFGEGTIDLKSEAIDLIIGSQPKEGIGVSVAGAALRLTRVGGTLADPGVVVNATDVASFFGTALVTGGLSIFAEVFMGWLGSDKSACQIALGEAGAK